MYSHPHAERVVRFVERRYKSIGLTLPAFQRRWIQRVYGTTRASGLRQYRRVYYSTPRKNAKSTLCAALALYHLVADHEPDPRIYIAAPNLDTAGESFEIMLRMVEADKKLNRLCIVRDSRNAKEIFYVRDGKRIGFIKALTKGQKEGKNASVVLFDELCSFKEPDRAIWNSMTKGSIARLQPLFIVTTTAAETNEGLAYEEYQHARAVLNGTTEDPELYPFIIEADTNKWDDLQEQIRCNPLVAEGFIPVENLQSEFLKAKVSDHALVTFPL